MHAACQAMLDWKTKELNRRGVAQQARCGSLVPENFFRFPGQAEAIFPFELEATTRFLSLLYMLRGVMPSSRAACA